VSKEAAHVALERRIAVVTRTKKISDTGRASLRTVTTLTMYPWLKTSCPPCPPPCPRGLLSRSVRQVASLVSTSTTCTRYYSGIHTRSEATPVGRYLSPATSHEPHFRYEPPPSHWQFKPQIFHDSSNATSVTSIDSRHAYIKHDSHS
jgi:hypothetical protein